MVVDVDVTKVSVGHMQKQDILDPVIGGALLVKHLHIKDNQFGKLAVLTATVIGIEIVATTFNTKATKKDIGLSVDGTDQRLSNTELILGWLLLIHQINVLNLLTKQIRNEEILFFFLTINYGLNKII